MRSDVALDAIPYLDVLDPGFQPHSAEVAAAREASWYARTSMGYAILRYEQASAVLGDRRFRQTVALMLTARGITGGPLFDWLTSTIIGTEGADHLRLRRLTSRAFTPRAVDTLRPLMRSVVEELLDRFTESGQCEFMADFADPYPARIICEMLGVPAEQQHTFRGWANDLGMVFSPDIVENRDRIEVALAGLYRSVDVLIEHRRGRPGPDLLSALIAAEEAGDRLTTAELRLMVSALLFGGQDTTRNQLGLAMATFIAHPGQWQRLAEQPELAGQAVEELFRVAPSAPANGRVAVEPVTLHGLDIPPGTVLHVITAAANTDPEVFGDGGFDITVPRPAPQLTFGGGLHYCLGAPLARAEIAEALPILARRLPAPRSAGPAQWRPAMGITGPRRLPIRFGQPATDSSTSGI
ncbi:MAG TPA: cytochrome P450 [Mycobacteriales bacterium]|nr:cytochrome P450 [Mycobacteriales bacterium]